MGETLKALRRLQEVERKLAVIRRGVAGHVRRIDSRRRQAKREDDKLEEQRLLARERQIRLDALNLDVAAREEDINKHRDALAKARTNKEYAAILTALNTEKADNESIENEILTLMEEVQRLQEEAARIDEDRKKFLVDVASAEETLRSFESASKAELDRLQADRAEYSEGIAPAALSSFTRVAEHHDGEAMAYVVKMHPKREEYGCGGCNMQIPLETVNTLKTRDEILVCSSCGRILCIEEST